MAWPSKRLTRGFCTRRWTTHCWLSYARRQRALASKLNSGLSVMVSGRIYRLVEAYPVTRYRTRQNPGRCAVTTRDG